MGTKGTSQTDEWIEASEEGRTKRRDGRVKRKCRSNEVIMDRGEVGGMQNTGTREETWNSICKITLADVRYQMIKCVCIYIFIYIHTYIYITQSCTIQVLSQRNVG